MLFINVFTFDCSAHVTYKSARVLVLHHCVLCSIYHYNSKLCFNVFVFNVLVCWHFLIWYYEWWLMVVMAQKSLFYCHFEFPLLTYQYIIVIFRLIANRAMLLIPHDNYLDNVWKWCIRIVKKLAVFVTTVCIIPIHVVTDLSLIWYPGHVTSMWFNNKFLQ